jgi:hypothetical protein
MVLSHGENKKNKRTEAVNRWTDNTMAKRKKNKRTEDVNRRTDNTMAKTKKQKRKKSACSFQSSRMYTDFVWGI